MVVQTIAVLTAFTAQAQTYNTGDIAVINTLIANNGLAWTTASTSGSSVPSDWTGVTWSSDASNKRITSLNTGALLTGSVNLTNLTALTTFICTSPGTANKMSGTLTLPNSTVLTTVDVRSNSLTSIDASKATGLVTLLCSNNSITSLDLHYNTKLTNVQCQSNQLTSLNLTGLSQLTTLKCGGNQLTSLTLTGLTKLTTVDLEDNQVTSLNLTGLTQLSDFNCGNNKLTTLDLSGCTAMTSVYAHINQLTSVNVTGLTNLMYLNVMSNKLLTLDLTTNTLLDGFVGTYQTPVRTLTWDNARYSLTIAMKGPSDLTGGITYASGQLRADNNLTPSTPFTETTGMSGKTLTGTLKLNYSGSPLYHAGDIAALNAIIDATGLAWAKDTPVNGSDIPSDWKNGNITWSGDELNKRITALDVSGKSLTGTLNTSALTELTSLSCYSNSLTGLNVTGNAKLATLYAYYNSGITELDLSGNPLLSDLKVYNNGLTSIDISANTELTIFSCAFNQITELDLSQNTKLTSISCRYNQISELDLSKNTLLTGVTVSGNHLTALDLSNNTAVTSLDAGSQTKTVTMTWDRESDKLVGELELNNPTTLNTAVTYLNGKLITNTASPASTSFAVETGLSGKTVSGTLTLDYQPPAVYHAEDIAVINAMIDNNNLGWTKTGPANVNTLPSNWTGITWGGGQYDKRITA
ncbi:MAG: hypothetical protein LBR67_04850, partial [Dysgonamonadaceae bacterium]|nr:hypothetical protein [Dysgonamonadaceae bacterium]